MEAISASNPSTARVRRITCATPEPGSRCANTSCTGRCITSRKATRTPWAIPRLTGRAKAAFVAIEFDEYGAGQGPRLHQQLFADLHDRGRSGLDVSRIPRRGPRRIAGRGEPDVAVRAAPLAARRRDRTFRVDGDHLSAGLPTDGPGATEVGRPARTCIAFYREHVEADAVHEQVVRHDVVGDLVATRTAARSRHRVRDTRARRRRKSLGGQHHGVVDGGPDVDSETARLIGRDGTRHLRWLVSHSGYSCCAGTCRSPP